MSKIAPLKIVEYYGRRSLHSRECEKLLTKVFYGCTDMIKCIVYDQKTIMNIRNCAHVYGCVLVVVSFYIQT